MVLCLRFYGSQIPVTTAGFKIWDSLMQLNQNQNLEHNTIGDSNLAQNWSILFKFDIFSVNDNRYIKTTSRTYGKYVPTNVRRLNVIEHGREFKCFRIPSPDSLLVYENKLYLQVYLGNFTSKL